MKVGGRSRSLVVVVKYLRGINATLDRSILSSYTVDAEERGRERSRLCKMPNVFFLTSHKAFPGAAVHVQYDLLSGSQ